MKRSTCASGSGYVPSCSMGFSVASTRKGAARGNVGSPMVTCFSCIDSSKALCTLAGARLISSARIRLAKSGPFLTVKLCVRLVDLRADQVGREQIGRELDALERELETVAQRLHRQGLRQSGNAFEQHVPAGDQPDQQPLDHLPLAHDHLPHLLKQRVDERGFLLDAV